MERQQQTGTPGPQVDRGFQRRRPGELEAVFDRHSSFIPSPPADALGRFPAVRPGHSRFVRDKDLRAALWELDLDLREEAKECMFHSLDHDGNGGLDLAEFRCAVQAGPRARGPRDSAARPCPSTLRLSGDGLVAGMPIAFAPGIRRKQGTHIGPSASWSGGCAVPCVAIPSSCLATSRRPAYWSPGRNLGSDFGGESTARPLSWASSEPSSVGMPGVVAHLGGQGQGCTN